MNRTRYAFHFGSAASALGAVVAIYSGCGGKLAASGAAASGVQPALQTPPSWATAANFVGRVSDAETVAIQLHFALRDAKAADAALVAISTPGSAQFGRFLSDAEYDAQFGPTAADVASVRAFLLANGLQVTHVPANRTFISATGTAAQMRQAFSTQLGLYKVGNETLRAPITPPSLPADIQPFVLGVLGLASPLQMKPGNLTVGGIQRNAIQPPAGAPTVAPPATTPETSFAPGQCSEWFGASLDTTDPPYAPARACGKAMTARGLRSPSSMPISRPRCSPTYRRTRRSTIQTIRSRLRN